MSFGVIVWQSNNSCHDSFYKLFVQ